MRYVGRSPGVRSPRKWGGSRRFPPLLMKEMRAAELESTGAPLTSMFHQLVGGKSGNGPGSAPLATGPVSAAADSAVLATRGAMTRSSAELPRTRTAIDIRLNIFGP